MKKQYIIKREKWVCGEDPELGESSLLNDQGRMCCLGQICNQSKVSMKRLYQVGIPSELMSKKCVPKWMISDDYANDDSDVVEEITNINDSISITHQERELILTELAEGIGVKLVFTGELKQAVKKGTE